MNRNLDDGQEWDDLSDEDQEPWTLVMAGLAAIVCPDAVLSDSEDDVKLPHHCEHCFDCSFEIVVNASLHKLLESAFDEAHACGKANLSLGIARKRAAEALARAAVERARAAALQRGMNLGHANPSDRPQAPEE